MDQLVATPRPLAELPLGASARIVGISGGRELSRRLLGLGLRIGGEIRLEHRRGRGLVVAAGAARIALGAGIAEKLLIVPLEPHADPAPPAAAGAG